MVRKKTNSNLLSRLEDLLNEIFSDDTKDFKIPTVQYIANQLNVSPNYLSDMLRLTTGKNTQQHIHEKLIEKAKEKLANTTLSISEIAYQLGFEHAQSFSKLFKNKTSQSPLEFRTSFQ